MAATAADAWIGKAAIMADRSGGGIVLRSDELDVLEFHAQIIDGFLNQIGVFVFGLTEIHGRNPNKENAAAGMAETRGLEPGIV